LCYHAYLSQYIKPILSLQVQASKKFHISFSQGNIILCGLYQYFFDNHLFKVAQNPLQKSDLLSKFQLSVRSKPKYLVLQTELSSFRHWACLTSSPDSSKIFWTCPVILPDLFSLLSKFSVSSKIFIFGLSLPSLLIYVIL
jgi:hypothetical protein